MNNQNFFERIESLSADWAGSINHLGPNRLDIEVDAGRVLDAVSSIASVEDCYLVAITGLDPGVESGQLWVLYHFAYRAEVATLRVTLRRETPVLPSIHNILPSASIFEQELGEILGVTFIEPGSDLPVYHNRLFIADDWPDKIYPLRKDFQGFPEPA